MVKSDSAVTSLNTPVLRSGPSRRTPHTPISLYRTYLPTLRNSIMKVLERRSAGSIKSVLRIYVPMAKWTNRDRIWNIALKKQEPIDPVKLAEALEVSERTVRDCLDCMADALFLEKRGGKGREPVRYYSVVDVE